MARRFLISPEAWGETVTLNEQELYHARRVLRLKPGDHVVVFDGQGKEAEAQVEMLRREEGVLRLLGPPTLKLNSPLRITLGQGMPKARKIDAIIEDATELGAHCIVALNCKRSVVKIHPDKLKSRLERWTRIASSAAKQCGRADVPSISPPLDLPAFLDSAQKNDALLIMAWVDAKNSTESKSLADVLRGEKRQNIWLMVGPEGGFTNEEATLAQEHGAKIISLGPRILRTETAGPALITLVQHICGDMG